MLKVFRTSAIYATVLASYLVINLANAAPEPPSPRCGGLFDLCWYVDRQTGAIVTDQRFERAHPFSEGLAAVRIKGRFGFIDTSTKTVIQPRFDLVGDFFLGMAEAMVDEKVGVINRRGEFVLQPQFARAVPFTKEVVLVREGTWCCKRFAGAEEIFGRPAGDSYPSKFRLFHLKTGWVTEKGIAVQHFDKSGRGLIWARASDERRPLIGLMRADGTWQVEPQYSQVSDLWNGTAIVGQYRQTRPLDVKRWSVPRSGVMRFGAVDKDGTLIVPIGSGPSRHANRTRRGFNHNPFRYPREQIINCPGGTRLYRNGPFWGVKGPTGNIIVNAAYRAISCYRHGLAWAAFDDKQAWCPIGPDGIRADRPSCVRIHYPHLRYSRHGKSLHEDGYESSVLWAKAYLEYGTGLRPKPPGVIPPNQF